MAQSVFKFRVAPKHVVNGARVRVELEQLGARSWHGRPELYGCAIDFKSIYPLPIPRDAPEQTRPKIIKANRTPFVASAKALKVDAAQFSRTKRKQQHVDVPSVRDFAPLRCAWCFRQQLALLEKNPRDSCPVH